MSIFNVGRLCVKLAGRDAGRKCVVVEQVDKTFVVVDGDVRRKKVNMKHLEPLTEVVDLKDKSSHEDVTSAFKNLGLTVWEKKSKQVAERPKKQKVKKVKPVKAVSKKEAKVEKVEEKVKVAEEVTKPVEDKAEVAKEVKAEEVVKSVEEATEVQEPDSSETIESEKKE